MLVIANGLIEFGVRQRVEGRKGRALRSVPPGGVVLSLDHNPNRNRNRNRNRNLNPPTLADSTRRRLPAHAGANASHIQALLPILALDAVARGLHSWRSREKRCRAEYRLPPHSKTLPPGWRASGCRASHFGVRWQAVFRATPLSGAQTEKVSEVKARLRLGLGLRLRINDLFRTAMRLHYSQHALHPFPRAADVL